MFRTSILVFSLMLWGIQCGPNPMEKRMQTFIQSYVEQVQPLQTQAALAYWEAATTGDAAKYDEYSDLQLQLKTLHSNTELFSQVKAFKQQAVEADPLLKRQLNVIYNAFLPNQVDSTLLENMVRLSSEVEKKFSTFRAEMDGETVTNNDIETILKTETNSKKRQQAWLASKQVGPVVAQDIIRLAQLRNQSAQNLGFPNYHTMSLAASEQNVEDIDRIFEELKRLTDEPFRQLKAELDAILADMYGVGVQGLMPWHYHDPFFQESPQVYEINLDQYYQDKDVVELAEQFFESINLPVSSILENSDLYEREGKNPHAFCTDIDRQGDVRILCNVKNNERWMETMLHELGHAVYDTYMTMDTPYLLREPAHAFTTEGIAMFFGRLSRNAHWMQDMLELSETERNQIAAVADKYMQLKQLIFARWAMVMYQFEKALYENPDQDLNATWWQLVKEYQYVNKPPERDEPDWAAKIHVALYPVYYHNYLLGELFASQLQHHITREVLSVEAGANPSYVNEARVGQFLRERVFEPGATRPWNDMIEQATGEPLNPQYFVEQFVH